MSRYRIYFKFANFENINTENLMILCFSSETQSENVRILAVNLIVEMNKRYKIIEKSSFSKLHDSTFSFKT